MTQHLQHRLTLTAALAILVAGALAACSKESPDTEKAFVSPAEETTPDLLQIALKVEGMT